MSDQCNNCTLKGDFKACKSAACFHHENWYARQMQSQIEQLTKSLEAGDELIMNSKVDVIVEFGCWLIDNHEREFAGGENQIQKLCADLINYKEGK